MDKGREEYQGPSYESTSVPASDREVAEPIAIKQHMSGGLRISPFMRNLIVGAGVLAVVVVLIGFFHTTSGAQATAQASMLTPSDAYRNASPSAMTGSSNSVAYPSASTRSEDAALPNVNGQTSANAAGDASVANALDDAANQTSLTAHHGMAKPAATLAPLATAAPLATDGPGIARDGGANVPNPGSNGIGVVTPAPNGIAVAVADRNGSDDLYVGDGNVGQHSDVTQNSANTATAAPLQIAQTTPARPTASDAGVSSGGSALQQDYLSTRKERPLGQFEIWVGTTIPAQLDTGINSRNESIVVAHTTEDIYDSKTGQVLVIPKFSRLVGHAGSAHAGQYRVPVIWEKLVWLDGSYQRLDSQEGADREGNSGLYADVKTPNILAASVFTGLLAGGTQLLAGGAGGGSTIAVNGGQVVGQSVGSSVAQTTGQILQQKANEPPELTVPRGQRFSVVLDRTMLLSPWVYDDSAVTDRAAP
jgi:type IV secretory pathway VirB10-like protein